ncbi:hypothetical protein ACOTJD_28200 [Achromobacter xylosoxidans]
MNTAISILILIAAFTGLLMLITGCCIGIWLVWRRRAMRQWIADFDQGLEREERLRARLQRRYRFRP